MSKRVFMYNEYGEYLAALIKQHELSQAEFARRVQISRTYLFDLFSGRVKPPAPEMQEKMISVLGLAGSDREEFYTVTARGRGELPKDIFDYLYNNAEAIEDLRERMRG